MIHNFITWSHHALAPPGWCQNCRRSWTSLGLSAWTWTQRAPWGTAGGCWRRSGGRSTATCLHQRWLFVLMIPVYFITHIAVFPNTCILFSYSNSRSNFQCCVTHILTMEPSPTFTQRPCLLWVFLRVSSVTVELLCDARCDTTQVLLQKKKKKKNFVSSLCRT